MYNLNVPKTNVILTLLKTKALIRICDMKTEILQWQKWKVTVKLFTHVIQNYHKKLYMNVVKVILLEGTWNKHRTHSELTFSFVPVTKEQITNLIRLLNNRKAIQLTHIPTKLINNIVLSFLNLCTKISIIL